MLVLLTTVRSILKALDVLAHQEPTSMRVADVVAAGRPSLDLLRWVFAGVKILYLHQHYMLCVAHCATD